MRGWERRGGSSSGDGRLGVVRGGRSGVLGDGLGSISPLTSTLVAGAMKVFQNVSGDTSHRMSASEYGTNALTGRALSRDCTTANRRADGDSSAAHGLSRIRPSPIAPFDTVKCWTIKNAKHGEERMQHRGTF
jgi:hypothetical protein